MRERHTDSSRYSSLIASEEHSVGSGAAIGQEEAYLSLMRPVRTDYVYKWRAACSLLQQTKRPFIRLDPHS